MNILLDYFFPITAIEPTAQPSTGFLKKACVVVKPKVGVETGEITLCSVPSEIAALTDNADAAQLLNAGLSSVFILPMDDLDLEDALEGVQDFYTLLISSDFSKAEVLGSGSIVTPGEKAQAKVQDILYRAKVAGEDGNDITISYIEDDATGNQAIVDVTGDAIVVDIDAAATTAETIAAAILLSSPANALVETIIDFEDEGRIQAVTGSPVSLAGGVDPQSVEATQGLDAGTFNGVIGVSDSDKTYLQAQANTSKRVGFYATNVTKARNMCFAFGKLLSNSLNWLNQQYISMPFADDVDTLGEANDLFDKKVSFVISDDQYQERLALFAAGGKAVAAPYIVRNLEIDMQGAALSFISGNQPGYTKKNASLLEESLQKVIDLYVSRQWIEAGTVEVLLEQDNFIASGNINIAEPKALWRIFAQLGQTL
jgi:hypothetical protein